ncbi:MAG: signal peptidase I [Bacteroidaceae bacterium]|nr:signal peptidase I [Bacteroidaceae bacterium]
MEFKIFNREVKTSRKELIKLITILVLYILFLFWVKSWLGIIVIPFIIDNYTTRFIPWNWWKKSKHATVRKVMGWVDAIVFALVAVYFVHLYFFQNYVIPTSSLEKSLLVGDYLFVSKYHYGPRKPQTPLSMPLTQHTMPVIGGKSYIDAIQWDYERVPGLEEIERGDIVVFNYPAGDVATTNPEVIDFHSICYEIGKQLNPNLTVVGRTTEEAREIYEKYYKDGKGYIAERPEIFGEIVNRPVDRRENYVKRCVGLPGNTLEIKDKVIYIDGKQAEQPENVQFNYNVELTQKMPESLRRNLDISKDDLAMLQQTGQLPLTNENYLKLKANTKLVKEISIVNNNYTQGIYPLNGNTGWTVDNYGPVWIPKRGESIALTLDNIAVYERPIVAYEGNTLEVKDGKIFINGKESNSYTFKMDYYWMMGDNRHNSADSRCWGFVPEDHIVGKPLFIWLSLDKDRGLFDGKIRWKRLFRSVESFK